MYYIFISQILFSTNLRNFELSLVKLLLLLDWLLVCIARKRRCLYPGCSLTIPCLMIASPTLHAYPFYFLFIPYFLSHKLILLLLTSYISSSQKYWFFQTTLLLLTLALVILFLLLELSADKVYINKFLLPLE